MLNHAQKVLLFSLLIAFSLVAQSNDVVPPISVDELPTNIKDKSPDELKELMAHIAGWSYQTLLKVSTQGLKVQQDSLKQIITLRKWLQAQQHPLLQLLALDLTTSVDSAILNEVYREEMVKHPAFARFYTSNPDSFDKPLLEQLLLLNQIDESALIEYVLTLDGQIAASSQQQNYTPEDYLNRIAQNIFYTELRDYLDIWENKIFNPAFIKFSKPFIADIIFIQTLELIDRKRDIRILMEVYFENGFPDNSKDFRNLVAQKLLPNSFRVRTGMAIVPFEVISSLHDYVQKGQRLRSHGLIVSILLFPYLSVYEVMPAEYHNFPEPFKNCIGNRLIYLEDMTPAEKDKLQGCSIIDSMDKFEKYEFFL